MTSGPRHSWRSRSRGTCHSATRSRRGSSRPRSQPRSSPSRCCRSSPDGSCCRTDGEHLLGMPSSSHRCALRSSRTSWRRRSGAWGSATGRRRRATCTEKALPGRSSWRSTRLASTQPPSCPGILGRSTSQVGFPRCWRRRRRSPPLLRSRGSGSSREARSRSDPVFVTALSAAALAFLALAKVISPQFMTWLLPLVPLLAGRVGRIAAALLAASMILTQFELLGWEGLHVDSWAVWLLLTRNILLLLLLVVVARELKRLTEARRYVTPSRLSSASRRARRSATSWARRTLSSVSRESTVE